MPKKFPPITALDWSPLHNLKHLKRKEREKLEKEQRDKENSGRQQKSIYIEIALSKIIIIHKFGTATLYKCYFDILYGQYKVFGNENR